MKTKRIVALALTAAMAVSMASTTAFAAHLWNEYQVGDKTAQDVAALTVAGGPAESDVGIKTGDNEWTEGFVANYEVYKPFANESNGVKKYLYRGGSSIKSDTVTQADGSTKTYTQKVINDQDTTQTGKEEAGILWKNFKTKAEGLGEPSLELEHEFVFLGWSVNKADYGFITDWTTGTGIKDSDKKAGDFCLADMDEIIAKGEAATPDANGAGTSATDTIKIYPVFRYKTAAEKLASQVEISKRAKVAKPVGEKEWVYTQKDLDRSTAYVSAPLAEAVSGDALKKCNAEMKNSRVYEVKPQVKDPSTGKNVLVDLKKGAVEEVKLPVTTVYNADGTATVLASVTTEDGLKDLIKKGKLKVYHIGSDGKSRQVTNLGTYKDDADKLYVTFKSGFYSEFVVTKDPNARAQAGEEDGASGGNPATGEASTLPVAMLALAALSATGVVAYKKRKAE